MSTFMQETDTIVSNENDFLRGLLDASHKNHFGLDIHFRQVWFNKQAAENHERLYGKLPIIGDLFFMLQDNHFKINYESKFFECLTGRHVEWIYEKQNGTNIALYYKILLDPIRDSEKKIKGISVKIEDVTHSKLLDAHIKQLAMVADKTQNVVIITDADGRITWVNHAFFMLTEYTQDEVLGKKPGTFLQGIKTDAQIVYEFRKAVENKEPFTCEIYNYSKSGRGYWLHIVMTPFYEGSRCKGFIAIETDITERKAMDAKLHDAIEQLQSLNQLKDKLISALSHDVKAPLLQLVTLLQFFEQKQLNQTDLLHHTIKVKDTLKNTLHYLLNLIEWTKGQHQGLRFTNQVLSLHHIVTTSLQHFSDYPDSKQIGVKISIANDILIKADQNAALFICKNLLNNALKHNKIKGAIYIYTVDDTSEFITLCIADTKHKIDSTQLADFLKCEAQRQEDEKIHGIGLKLSKEFAELNMGTIWSGSRNGKGFTFYARFKKALE